jgi:hypothetical protein
MAIVRDDVGCASRPFDHEARCVVLYSHPHLVEGSLTASNHHLRKVYGALHMASVCCGGGGAVMAVEEVVVVVEGVVVVEVGVVGVMVVVVVVVDVEVVTVGTAGMVVMVLVEMAVVALG